MSYKKKTITYHEWEMIEQTLQEMCSKAEWINEMLTENTDEKFITKAIKLSYKLLKNAELIKEEE